MSTDPYTAHARLCDDTGMVSNKPVTPANPFDPGLTYRQQLSNLRGHTGLDPYTGEPFPCTGSVHLAREHIACTSPAHRPGAAPSGSERDQ